MGFQWATKNLPSHARRHLSVMRLDDSQDLPETLEALEPRATPEPATQEPLVMFLHPCDMRGDVWDSHFWGTWTCRSRHAHTCVMRLDDSQDLLEPLEAPELTGNTGAGNTGATGEVSMGNTCGTWTCCLTLAATCHAAR